MLRYPARNQQNLGDIKASLRLTLRMDWNLKTPLPWDWENLALFGGKESELCRSSHQHDWKFEGGTLCSSSSGACSVSELGNGSSKSSISASMDSSSKAAMKVPAFNFEAVEVFPKNLGVSKESARVEDTGTSPAAMANIGPGEPPIGLKLGKRTYFEDVCAGNNIKNPSVTPSTEPVKRTRLPHQSVQTSYCQVDGCNVDLTTAKDYHRKHRVCESHSKSPKVTVAGLELRFCQQCSRFHDLSKFDQKKRSCRKRLSDHNARRRKPHPKMISFNSSRLPSSFHDDGQQVNLLFSRAPFGHMRTIASPTLEGSGGFKLTQTKAGSIDGQLHLPGNELSNSVSILHHDLDRLLPFKGTTAEVLSQGLGASASNLDGAPDVRRALSLLSTNSSCSVEPRPISHTRFLCINNTPAAHPAMHVVDTSTELWQEYQPIIQHTRAVPFDLQSTNNHTNNHLQEFQLLKTPYEAASFDPDRMH